MSSNNSDDEHPSVSVRESRVARKSTTAHSTSQQPSYSTRRQTALQQQQQLQSRNVNAYRASLRSTADQRMNRASDRFMENFNPETSAREKRKLNRKINTVSTVRRPPGALYDENGIHIKTYMDLCDCLNEDCEGCFFDCPKCGSQKCGTECRVHRTYIVEQVEYHGYDKIIKSPLLRY